MAQVFDSVPSVDSDSLLPECSSAGESRTPCGGEGRLLNDGIWFLNLKNQRHNNERAFFKTRGIVIDPDQLVGHQKQSVGGSPEAVGGQQQQLVGHQKQSVGGSPNAVGWSSQHYLVSQGVLFLLPGCDTLILGIELPKE